MQGDSLLLELDELPEVGELLLEKLLVLLVLGKLLVLDPLLKPLLELGSDEPDELLSAELLLEGCDEVLLWEFPLPTELAEDKELPDVGDDELLLGGR